MSNPTTPSHAPEPFGAVPSRIPPPSPDALAAIDGTVKRLRAELAATTDKNRQGRLLFEIGEIEERAGDEPSAARDYLAAFNAEPTFREPLEGLVRLLERRRSLKNLGKLVDALTRAAQKPDEKARALLMKAAYLEDVAGDLDGAKQAANEAAHAEAPENEAASAWLALEILAAKQADAVLREEALEERAKGAGDATWRGLLLLDVAKLLTALGDVDGALETLAKAKTEASDVAFAAAVAIDRLTRRESGMVGTEEATARAEAHAIALEEQGIAIHEAMQSVERGDALGVPRWMRNITTLADAWLRAAEARRLAGNLDKAALLLDRAMEIVDNAQDAEIVDAPVEDREPPPGVDQSAGDVTHEPRHGSDAGQDAENGPQAAPATQTPPASIEKRAEKKAPTPALVDAALAGARIRIAEVMGDTALAARLAQRRMLDEKDGGIAAALAMRVAEQAASEGDGPRALEALSLAIQRDPGCLPARALQLDLLADGGEPSAFASQLESFADHLATDDARGRTFLLAAFSWAVQAGDVAGAKAALSQASMYGVAPATTARLARALASLGGDALWFEEATKRLIASGASEPESVPLWVELLRARFARNDVEGIAKTLRELSNAPHGAWLGRILEAFLPERFDPERTAVKGEARRRLALDELAGLDGDPDVARSLALLAAIRAHAAADIEGARRRLVDLVARDPADALAATYLADLERARAAHAAAADVAASAAAASSDGPLAAALYFEAGFERWRDGNKKVALESFDEAAVGAPAAAKIVLGWAARGVDVDSLEGRRHALSRGLDGGADPCLIALERFATELGGGDPDDAATALRTLEEHAAGDLAVAGALARLSWSQGATDDDAIRTALGRIGALGPGASTFAAAERTRVARDATAGNVDDIALAARSWFDAGGGLTAAMEWLGAALTVGHAQDQRAAREAIAMTLQGEGREQMLASAASSFAGMEGDSGAGPVPLIVGSSAAARLANLELAPPGCDPRRRATALIDMDTTLGEDAQLDALGLAAWSALAAGDTTAAIAGFERVSSARPDDIVAWEGLRTCAQLEGTKQLRAVAAGELGARSSDAARGAGFLEESGLLWLELGDNERAEVAFERGFERDPSRSTAFDKLFRAVRERKESDKLLAIISRRLDVTDDPQEIAKLFWEQARVLREQGDQDGALKALEHVVMLEPDHVGALALTGEIALKRGLFEEAATALARLSAHEAAPAKNRVTAGVAAVDIFENKLDRFDKALEVLLALHKAKLSSLPVRERLARAAARTGSWTEATAILEELMYERPEAEGRIEAARLAMAIHRDRLSNPNGARRAIVKLLEESPTDGEALDMLVATEHAPEVQTQLLKRAHVTLLTKLQARPTDLPSVKRLAKVARAISDDALQQAALSVAVVLSGGDAATEQLLAQLAAKKGRVPQVALTETIFRQILAPGDDGPVAQLFRLLGPTLAEALGPSLQACGVTKKDKVDPRSGLALRNEIATWTGAFGIPQFDLYVGGKDPLGVQGVPGEIPSLVVGSGVNAPLAPTTRARVARELLAVARGTTVVRSRDEITVAAIVAAACNLAEVKLDHPPYAVLAEVERLISKALARKSKKQLPDVCRAIVASGTDPRAWSRRALASHARIAAIASGDAGVVLSDVLNEPLERLATAVKGEPRAEELLRFMLSPGYLDLRRSLGLEGAS